MNQNEETTKTMGCIKTVLSWKCVAINMYIRKRSQISDLTFHLNALEKEEQTKPKAGRRKWIKTRSKWRRTKTQ